MSEAQPTPAGLSVVVFDVNETLSDLSPMAERFSEVGVSGQFARTWFAGLLRDGFALAAAGSSESFGTIAKEMLRTVLVSGGVTGGLDEAVEHIMAGFLELPVHPDVPEGIQRMHDSGLRLVTLTNGATAVAERLLTSVGLGERFERYLSVDDADAWKPVRSAYEYAGRVCESPLERMLLVAVHPWDIDGAARAGMPTAWINRTGMPFPSYFTAPTYTASGVDDLAAQLAALVDENAT